MNNNNRDAAGAAAHQVLSLRIRNVALDSSFSLFRSPFPYRYAHIGI